MEKIKIKTNKDFINKVKYTCHKIPNKEWAGILIYSLDGSITNINTLTITLEDIFPIKKDTASSFETTYPDEFYTWWAGQMVKYPERIKFQLGLIHSHCNMGVFFSPGDNAELIDNHKKYKFFLSIVTNNQTDFVGKMIIPLQSIKTIAIDEDGKQYEVKLNKSSRHNGHITYACNFIDNIIPTVDKDFLKQVDLVIKKAEPKASYLYPYNNSMERDFTNNNYYGGDNYGKKSNLFGVEEDILEDEIFKEYLKIAYHMIFGAAPVLGITLEEIKRKLRFSKITHTPKLVKKAIKCYKQNYYNKIPKTTTMENELFEEIDGLTEIFTELLPFGGVFNKINEELDKLIIV